MPLRSLSFRCGRILSLFSQAVDLIENSLIGVDLQTGQSSVSATGVGMVVILLIIYVGRIFVRLERFQLLSLVTTSLTFESSSMRGEFYWSWQKLSFCHCRLTNIDLLLQSINRQTYSSRLWKMSSFLR